MAQNIGTLLGSAIRPADSLDEFPVFHANEGLGGFYSVADIAERNAITSSRRVVGMRVKVISEDKDYELVGGIANGNWVEVTNVIEKTVAEITSLIASNGLQIGYTYNITDADVDLFGGNSIFLQAVATNRLSPSGVGLFYDPKFDHSDDHNGVWNNFMYPTMSSIVGTFTPNETVTANNGATATYLASGFLRFISGNWTSATSMTGGTSSATSNIAGQVTPSYAIGVKRVWGGKMWTNVNGNVGNSIDEFTLNSEWSVIAFNATDYNLVADPIEYDLENDMIIYRKDKSGQEVRTTKDNIDILNENSGLGNPIKHLQWGNYYNWNTNRGNGLNIIDYGILNSLNICLKYFICVKLYQNSYLFNIISSKNSVIEKLILEQESTIKDITFGENSTFNNLKLGQNSNLQYFTLSKNIVFSDLEFASNTSLALLSTGEIKQNIQNIIFESGIYGADLSAATFIYGSYAKTIRARQDGQGVLTYWNNSNNLVIANITD